MNTKAQVGEISAILVVFIAVVVGVILFQTIAQNVGDSIHTIDLANLSTGVATNNTPVYLTNYKSISNVVMYNETGDYLINSGNYTIENNVVYNGAEAVKLTPQVDNAVYLSNWKISGTAQPLTYISNSGGRAMASLITIFFALTISLVALYPVLKSKILK